MAEIIMIVAVWSGGGPGWSGGGATGGGGGGGDGGSDGSGGEDGGGGKGGGGDGDMAAIISTGGPTAATMPLSCVAFASVEISEEIVDVNDPRVTITRMVKVVPKRRRLPGSSASETPN